MRTLSIVSSTLCLFLMIPVVGCVGPTTPLGAVDHSLKGGQTNHSELFQHTNEREDVPEPTQNVAIYFAPNYQQVHDAYAWQVIIRNPSRAPLPDPARVRVFYNNMEVTNSASFQFHVEYRVSEDRLWQELVLTMKHLRLNAMKNHEIRVDYTTLTGETISSHYPFPFVEDLAAEERIASIAPFDTEPEVLKAIYEASREYRINPVLLAALIAQESSFNPYALSKAKALGLTQITDLAEKDIARRFREWPRHPKIRKLSRRKLKRMIPRAINRENEWRLDPIKSVWGGAYYLGYIRDRLLHENNLPLIKKGGKKQNQILLQTCLASYNSGLSRVLQNISEHEDQWLDQRNTREAKRYIRKILSYYGVFKKPEDNPSQHQGERS